MSLCGSLTDRGKEKKKKDKLQFIMGIFLPILSEL